MLEDRSVGIGIDCRNVFRLGDTGHVLTGASDGDGEIQVGCNFLTSLSDLKGWWHPTGVTSSARRGELGAQYLSEWFQFIIDRSRTTDTTAARNYHSRFFQTLFGL